MCSLMRPHCLSGHGLRGRSLVAKQAHSGVAWRLRSVVIAHGGPDATSSGEEAVIDPFAWKIKKSWKASDGTSHVGSTLAGIAPRPFPGPPPSEGPPLRVLPIGGLGEIGMNCMLVGVKDRYILIDAGLLFPDFQDLGMQKILPDVSFLAQWRDKIEAVVITHGHEDHIGALPWVIPALDPSTPVYAGSFVMQLVARRLQEYNLYNPERFKVFNMLTEYEMGPFHVTPIRVTHSIPDCCGLIMRSDHGTIVHTGDWKIDEDPVDGEMFDRTTFDLLSKEPISLMMSDSTNVLSPGRTSGENTVRESLCQKVLAHEGMGRVVVTQFASNLHRLASVKAAADAAGRKICFIGTSLNTYLEAAYRDGRAPINPADLIKPDQLAHHDPSKVLIVTTGSQAEPRAQLSLASRSASQNLKIGPQDLILYSAKVIPGNETKVAQMLNSLAMQGARVVAGRADNLHVSGHAYQGELEEVLRFVKPQHFLPVHGEYSFLVEHARLAKERAGVLFTDVIKNGQMLGVYERRNRNTISTGSMAAATVKQELEAASAAAAAGSKAAAAAAAAAAAEQGGSGMKVIGEVDLLRLFNDGGKGTGTAAEMAIPERETMAFEGIVVVAVDITRQRQALRGAASAAAAAGCAAAAAAATGSLTCRARVTTRGMWTGQGKLLDVLHQAVQAAVSRLPGDASLGMVERQVIESCQKAARWFNNKKPEVIVVAYEHDPRASLVPGAASRRREQLGGGAAGSMQQQQQQQQQQRVPWQQRAGPPAPTQQQQQQQQQPVAADAGGRDTTAAAAAAKKTAVSKAMSRLRRSASSSSSSSSSSSDATLGSSSSNEQQQQQQEEQLSPPSKASPKAADKAAAEAAEPPAAPRATRRRKAATSAAAAALPPLQVLPDGVELPSLHTNPRQNPSSSAPDADLAFD